MVEQIEETPVGASEAPAVEATPVETQPEPQAAPAKDFDSLLAEYNQAAVPDQPAAETPQATAAPKTSEQLLADAKFEQQLNEILGTSATPQVTKLTEYATALEQSNAQMREAAQRAQDEADFKQLATELQARLPEYCAPDHAEVQMLAMASKNSELAFAFSQRNADRAAIDLELRRCEALYTQLLRTPGADPKKIQELAEFGYRLGLALNAPEILRRAARDIERRAHEHAPIDADATEDRAAVYQAVKNAGAKIGPEPAPAFGRMGDRELADYTGARGPHV